MNKSIVLVLLFNICLGIVAPSIAVFNNRSLEEAVVLVNLEKDVEMEEEELDETIFFFEPQLKQGSGDTPLDLSLWFDHHYQEIYLMGVTLPPQNVA